MTNLNDSGPGSLRDAVSTGPRIVVFDVGGYITLQSPLGVKSNITIAGQTAPGEGIATRGYQVSTSSATNVIIRYLRFRHGLTPNQNRDGVTIHASLYAHNKTRNPKVKGRNQFVNNVVYNWSSDAYIEGDSAALPGGPRGVRGGRLPHRARAGRRVYARGCRRPPRRRERER